MDETVRHIASRSITNMEKSIKIRNYSDAVRFTRDIISISLAKDSKPGLLTGEVLESSLAQYGFLLYDYNTSREEIEKEDGLLLGLVAGVRSAMEAGSENEVYEAFSKLRMHVTREQMEGFPTKYRIKARIQRGLRHD